MKKKKSATPARKKAGAPARAKPTKYYDWADDIQPPRAQPEKSPAAPRKTAKPKRPKPAKYLDIIDPEELNPPHAKPGGQ